jgi:hypothetical protein
MLFELVKLTFVLVPLVVPDELPVVDIEDVDDGVVVAELGVVVAELGVVVAELGVVVAELGVERTNVLDIVAPAKVPVEAIVAITVHDPALV